MSISKSFNKKTGITYVYDVYENYWDKDLKKQVTKRRLIGKIDPKTGEMIPTRQRKPKDDNPHPDQPTKTLIPDFSSSDTLSALRSMSDSLALEISRLSAIKEQCDSLLATFSKQS